MLSCYGGNLNSHRAASLLVREVEEEERYVVLHWIHHEPLINYSFASLLNLIKEEQMCETKKERFEVGSFGPPSLQSRPRTK
ncbi:hypothetical protein TNCV_4952561 [Trichonephila clavipes]|nr:hypothetical protein TNCV_4952561 [Trichonephila clavipes]